MQIPIRGARESKSIALGLAYTVCICTYYIVCDLILSDCCLPNSKAERLGGPPSSIIVSRGKRGSLSLKKKREREQE